MGFACRNSMHVMASYTNDAVVHIESAKKRMQKLRIMMVAGDVYMPERYNRRLNQLYTNWVLQAYNAYTEDDRIRVYRLRIRLMATLDAYLDIVQTAMLSAGNWENCDTIELESELFVRAHAAIRPMKGVGNGKGKKRSIGNNKRNKKN